MNNMFKFPSDSTIKTIFQTPRGKTILNRVINTIKRYRMIKKGEKIVLGVSGGGDSVFLVIVFHTIKQLFNIQISIAHLNHLLREDSYQDEEFVRTIGEALRIPVFIERIDVRSMLKSGDNLEEVARNLRLDFLRRTKEKLNANKIALGHTLTDSAETFIFNLSRGAGFQGLTGIWPVRGDIIRPIITFKRSEIRSFLDSEGIPYMEDPTNYDINLTRNYIRHRVIPAIEGRFPRVQEHIFQTAELNRELSDYLNKQIPDKTDLLKWKGRSFDVLDTRMLLGLAPIFQRWFFYRNYGLGYREVDELLKKLRAGGHLETGEYEIWVSFGEIMIARRGHIPLEPIQPPLRIKRNLTILEYNMALQILVGRCRDFKETRNSVLISEDVVDRSTLQIRSWKYGDRVYLSGKMVKVKDIFQKHRVPVWRRRLWTIVEDKYGILWIVGLVKADRKGNGKNCLRLEVKKINEQKGWIFDY